MSCEGRDWISRLPAELDGQRAILLGLLDWSQHDERVRWLVVACSVGRGNADKLSDLDLGMAVTSEDFDAVVADVHQTVDGLADLVDSYQHKIDGLATPHWRIFAQYTNRCQVDLVVIPATEAIGAVNDEVVLYDPDGLRTATFEPVTSACGLATRRGPHHPPRWIRESTWENVYEFAASGLLAS